MTYDLICVGAGPTGLACAIEAKRAGDRFKSASMFFFHSAVTIEELLGRARRGFVQFLGTLYDPKAGTELLVQ